MPKHIIQPEGSSLCGQCCVAMAANVSVRSVVEILGEGGTTTGELVLALRYFGLSCADRAKRISKRLPIIPPKALVTIARDKEESQGRKGEGALAFELERGDYGPGWNVAEWVSELEDHLLFGDLLGAVQRGVQKTTRSGEMG